MAEYVAGNPPLSTASSAGPMWLSALRGSAGRTEIPRVFILTDKVWSDRASELNRTLAALHPSCAVRFYDNDAARAFLQKRYGERHASAFEKLRSGAHRADLFRYAVLLADGRAVVCGTVAKKGFDTGATVQCATTEPIW